MESFPTHGVGDVSNKDVLDVWRNNDVKIQSKWPCMLYYADMFDFYLNSKPQSFFFLLSSERDFVWSTSKFASAWHLVHAHQNLVL